MGGVIAAAEVACTSDSATVFCATKPATIDRFYANIASGCSCFYRCTVSSAAGLAPPTLCVLCHTSPAAAYPSIKNVAPVSACL